MTVVSFQPLTLFSIIITLWQLLGGFPVVTCDLNNSTSHGLFCYGVVVMKTSHFIISYLVNSVFSHQQVKKPVGPTLPLVHMNKLNVCCCC